MEKTLFIFALVVSQSLAFQLSSLSANPPLQLRRTFDCSSRVSQWSTGSSYLKPQASLNVPSMRSGNALTSLRMGIFGLGWGELAVIGGIALLIFGPKNLAGLGKDLGKIAGQLKQEASTFSEAMNESLNEASKAMEAGEKEAMMTKNTPPAVPPPAEKPAVKKIDISDV